MGTARALGEGFTKPFTEGAAKLNAGDTFGGTAQITEAASDTILNAATGGGKAVLGVILKGGKLPKVDLPDGTPGNANLGDLKGGDPFTPPVLDIPRFSKADFPPVGTKISPQKQERHLTGGRGKDPDLGGELTNANDAQAVLDAFHSGDARIVGKTVQGDPIVEFKGVTGINKNQRAGFPNQPTNVFIIKGTKSVSVVPTSPTKAGK